MQFMQFFVGQDKNSRKFKNASVIKYNILFFTYAHDHIHVNTKKNCQN
jgi:hypothetical protein